MLDRAAIVADSLGSLRAEGLEPTADVQAVAEAWADGRVSPAQLQRAKRALLAGEDVARFAPAPAAAR